MWTINRANSYSNGVVTMSAMTGAAVVDVEPAAAVTDPDVRRLQDGGSVQPCDLRPGRSSWTT